MPHGDASGRRAVAVREAEAEAEEEAALIMAAQSGRVTRDKKEFIHQRPRLALGERGFGRKR